MGYLLYSLSFAVLVFATALYFTRSRWASRVPIPSLIPEVIYSRLPQSFQADMEAGFSSSNFDLNENLEAGDSRSGLNAAQKREINKIMKQRKCGFDEARRIFTEQRFAKNNIGPDGRPRDPKFVSFS